MKKGLARLKEKIDFDNAEALRSGEPYLKKALAHVVNEENAYKFTKDQPYTNYQKRIQHKDLEIGTVEIEGSKKGEDYPNDILYTVSKTDRPVENLNMIDSMSKKMNNVGLWFILGFLPIMITVMFLPKTPLVFFLILVAFAMFGIPLFKAIIHESGVRILPSGENNMYLLSDENSSYISHYYSCAGNDNISVLTFTSLLSRKLDLKESNKMFNLWLNNIRRLTRLDPDFKIGNIPVFNKDLGEIVDALLEAEEEKKEPVELTAKDDELAIEATGQETLRKMMREESEALKYEALWLMKNEDA